MGVAPCVDDIPSVGRQGDASPCCGATPPGAFWAARSTGTRPMRRDATRIHMPLGGNEQDNVSHMQPMVLEYSPTFARTKPPFVM